LRDSNTNQYTQPVSVNILFDLFVINPATTYLFAELTNTSIPQLLATIPLPDVLRTILQYTPEVLFNWAANMAVAMWSAKIIFTWRIDWQLEEQLRKVDEILARMGARSRENRRVEVAAEENRRAMMAAEELVDSLNDTAEGS
jgi:hypothetical protein